ncbi:unnamed protein product [Amaranthus hypochondriacus]
MNKTSHFVLVHGASHGGWCWYKIKDILENMGYKVSCPDLTSSGTDRTDADTVFTFKHYNQPLHHLLETLPFGEKVILVGHSAGGHSLTKSIHEFPDKIEVAIFIAAAMLRNGYVTPQDLKHGAPNLSQFGEVFDYGYGQGRDNPPTSVLFKKAIQRQVLYQMSPSEDISLASMLLRPCPIRALKGMVFEGGKDVDKVRRVYIKTLHDNVITVEQQDSMIKRWPPLDVYSIDSDHCPMFSNPSQLLGLLVKIAARFCS